MSRSRILPTPTFPLFVPDGSVFGLAPGEALYVLRMTPKCGNTLDSGRLFDFVRMSYSDATCVDRRAGDYKTCVDAKDHMDATRHAERITYTVEPLSLDFMERYPNVFSL